MNRPLKRKLENAVLRWLDTNKAGTSYAAIPLYSSGGTTLADEAAIDANQQPQPTSEPPVPFIAVYCEIEIDPDLPGVAAVTVTAHLKTEGTGPSSDRNDADAVLRGVYDVLIRPPNDAAAFSDGNPEFGAFITFANLPDDPAPDLREAYRTPLHVYDLSLGAFDTANDGDFWHDQVTITGTAQDMNNR